MPPIIDVETFQAAQQQLRRNWEASPRNRKYHYLLTGGRLLCGPCGKHMTGYCKGKGQRGYRCTNVAHVNPSLRCRARVAANLTERQVWAVVLDVLQNPALILAELTRQQATADDQRAEIQRELDLIETALAKCDREEQRWTEAYAAEVINIIELKVFRAEIAARRKALQTQRDELRTKRMLIGQAVGQVEGLLVYGEKVRERLQTFDATEKRLALEALDIRVTWRLGEPLAIQGSLPVREIVPTPSVQVCRPSCNSTLKGRSRMAERGE